MNTPPRLGILIALPIEARCFIATRARIGQTITVHDRLLIHITGMGAASAQLGAQTLLQQPIDALISWGTAGGLCPSLKPGHLLIPDYVVDTDGATFPTHSLWQQHLCATLATNTRIHRGNLLQAKAVITSRAAKRLLFQNTQAVAVDMESAAIAQIARQANLPFTAIRAITDSAHVSLPTWLTTTFNANGNIKPHTFLQKFLCAPHTWLALIHVARGYSAAKSSLQVAANSILTANT